MAEAGRIGDGGEQWDPRRKCVLLKVDGVRRLGTLDYGQGAAGSRLMQMSEGGCTAGLGQGMIDRKKDCSGSWVDLGQVMGRTVTGHERG